MNPALTDKATRIRPDTSWGILMQNAAREVFELMVGTEINSTENPPEGPSGEVSALVGMAGSICAVFRLRCSGDAAASIASKMLGGQAPGDSSHTWDAMGEICNMVAGNFKAKVAGLAEGCMLSVPTVVAGEDYDVYPLAGRDRIEVSLDFEGRPIWVILEISG